MEELERACSQDLLSCLYGGTILHHQFQRDCSRLICKVGDLLHCGEITTLTETSYSSLPQLTVCCMDM